MVPENTTENQLKGYTYIEIKLFTAPTGDEMKVLKRRLQKAQLQKYFESRHLFGLIGFSYLRHKDNIDPVSKNDPRLTSTNKPNLWCLHLILLNEGFLQDFNDAPKRAQAIFNAIDKHNALQPLSSADAKEFIYVSTYNLVRVIKMSQTIVRLEHTIEEKNKKIETERYRAETEKHRAEKYLKKLKEMGINPDE